MGIIKYALLLLESQRSIFSIPQKSRFDLWSLINSFRNRIIPKCNRWHLFSKIFFSSRYQQIICISLRKQNIYNIIYRIVIIIISKAISKFFQIKHILVSSTTLLIFVHSLEMKRLLVKKHDTQLYRHMKHMKY